MWEFVVWTSLWYVIFVRACLQEPVWFSLRNGSTTLWFCGFGGFTRWRCLSKWHHFMRKTFNGCVYFLTFVRPDMVLPMASCLSLLRFDNTVISANSQYANVSNVKPGCACHQHSFFKGTDEDNVANNCIPQALRNACAILWLVAQADLLFILRTQWLTRIQNMDGRAMSDKVM